MPFGPGQFLTLAVEKPAAGGRMIARAGGDGDEAGQIVLVSGAIPGERVTVRVERVAKGVVYAQTATIDEPSADRREPAGDPLCGGCLYAHIAYDRQREIKAHVVADAFARIARLELPSTVAVAASPVDGYRMRARFHVRGGRIGFFREGTHDLCDVRETRQLTPATCDVLDRLSAGLRSLGLDTIREIELSENISASERVVHFDTAGAVDARALAALGRTDGLTGLSASHPPSAGGVRAMAGDPYVSDLLQIEGRDILWRRHVLAFFQGNRYLLGDLVSHVVAQVPRGSRVIDLYAGAGLFSVPAAVVRGALVTAVEGDRRAAADLDVNARQAAAAVEAVHQSVERFVARTDQAADVLILDPPRTGMSREALAGAIRLRAREIIYVSCDVATLARDTRGLVEAGYALAGIDGFDMFPNTPHVEVVAKFARPLR
jgi:23S rRNA (uracil1939-C5)-methyltransferase